MMPYQMLEPTEEIILYGIRDTLTGKSQGWKGQYIWTSLYDAQLIIDIVCSNLFSQKSKWELETYIVAKYKRVYLNEGNWS